jgi:tetrahydromethanopterin S-methyltransferase subunit C
MAVVVLVWLLLWAQRVLDPWHGSFAWVAAIALIWFGMFAVRSRHASWGWGAAMLGLSIGIVGLSSVIAVVVETGYLPGLSGGTIGSFVAATLSYWVAALGALIVSAAMVLVGTGMTLRAARG